MCVGYCSDSERKFAGLGPCCAVIVCLVKGLHSFTCLKMHLLSTYYILS